MIYKYINLILFDVKHYLLLYIQNTNNHLIITNTHI